MILDAEHGEITDANPFLLDLLDYPFEELRGRRLWEIGQFKCCRIFSLREIKIFPLQNLFGTIGLLFCRSHHFFFFFCLDFFAGRLAPCSF